MELSTLLIPIGSIGVSFITLFGVIYTASRRKDPTTAEVWAENSNLRNRLDAQDQKIDAQGEKIDNLEEYRDGAERQITILGTAFDILFRLIGTANLTPADKATVEQARALRTGSGSIPRPSVN